MKILITGASSYVGSRLYRDLKEHHDVIGTYSKHQLSPNFIHLDISDNNEIELVMKKHTPDIILHVAQNPDPRWCEAHPTEANILNIESTKHLINCANTNSTKIIYISSFAAIKPNNIYAKTKYASELLVKTAIPGFLIIRPAFILGYSPNTTNDRPFNRLLKNLDQGTSAVYDTSWKFQPTFIGHISAVILSCIERGIWEQTIHVTVPEFSTRYETARDILQPFGISVTPIDNHDTTNVIHCKLDELEQLNLPKYTYKQMINSIIDEIKHRDKFILT